MNADHPVLETKGLSIRIAGRTLVDGLNLRIRCGERWGILGPNGCGKTSLLHCLGGIRRPESGEVCMNGTPLDRMDSRRRARHLGIMLQNEDYVFPTTVLERVLAGRHPHLAAFGWETASDVQLAMDSIRKTGLEGMENRSVTSLSGGERRRVQIAALLCQSPTAGLLDEPENDLDLRYQSSLLNLVANEFGSGKRAMVLVCHDISLAVSLCSHLLLIENGKTVFGEADQVATETRLSSAFGCRIRKTDTPVGPIFSASP